MEQEVSDIVFFLGRFHPVILHLPVGFLVMAAILEGYSRFKKTGLYEPAIRFILLFGSISAGTAALLGYLLAQEGGYNEQILAIHQWSGIGVTVTSSGAYMLKKLQKAKESVVLDRAYLAALSAVMLTLLVAGHYGGTLTHGSDYLTQHMPDRLRVIVGLPPKEETGFRRITNLPEADIYSDIIYPILETRCASCHNESKNKGELQMQTRDLLLKGGEGGPVIIKGNAGESELIRRINLPEHHDDYMPPKGKRPLTHEHKKLLEWWIDSGSPFDKKVEDVEVSDEILLALNTLIDPVANMSPAEKLLASEVEPAGSKQLEILHEHGVSVRPVSKMSHWLQADIPQGRSADSLVTELANIAAQLIWLDLGGTSTTDAALEKIGTFSNLTRLHLQNTGITDAGLSHLTSLSNLEYLNLYGTYVSDQGIQQLQKLTNLKKLFVWRTQVTTEGTRMLQKALPGLDINLGMSDTAGMKTEETDNLGVEVTY